MPTLDTDSETGKTTSYGEPYSYLGELKSKLTPAQYNALIAPLMYTANEVFGGKVQDYQAQLLMPINTAKAGVPKQLEFEPIKRQQVEDSEGGSYTQVTGGNPKTPNVVGDSESGYRSEKPIDINGVPVYANYDASGKLLGYEGDNRTTSWINGKQRIIGNWDANGMPNPQTSTSRGSGFSGFVGDIMSDPVLGAAANIAASYFGGPLGTAALGLAQGKDLEDIAKNAAISYAAGQVGAGVGAETGSGIAGGSAAGATGAALRGGDIGQGALSGGINAGIGSAAKDISDANFENWAKEQASNTYDNAPSPTEKDVLDYIDRESADSPLSTLDRNNPAYAADNIDVGGGFNPATGTGDAATAEAAAEMPPLTPDLPPEAYDPALSTGQIKTGLGLVKDALLAPDKSNTLQPAKTNQYATQNVESSIPWLNTKEQMLRNQPRMGCASTQDAGAMTPELQNIYSNLNPELAKEFAKRGIGNNFMRGDTPIIGGLEMKGYAAAGTVESETCSTWGAMGKYMPKFHPISGSGMLSGGGGRRQQSGLAPLKHMYSGISPSGNMGGMAKGGLPSKYHDAAPDGHNPEFVTGLTGYYACGGGTGQSDDIPAMLHDGDYVMDAEAVSALGDGSSKAGREVLEGFRKQVPHKDGAQGKPVPAKIADGEYVFPASFVTALGGGDNKKGADILNGLREKLRTHKRSAPTSKIPPKALSPLDYLKQAESGRKS